MPSAVSQGVGRVVQMVCLAAVRLQVSPLQFPLNYWAALSYSTNRLMRQLAECDARAVCSFDTTHLHACIHPYIHTGINTCMHTYIPTHTHTHTRTHTCIRTYIPTQTRTHTHARIHTYMHTYTPWIHKCVTNTRVCATHHKHNSYSVQHYTHFTKQRCRSSLPIQNATTQ